MPAEVPAEESVWRSAVFPVAFKVIKRQPNFSSKAFFKLYSDSGSPYVFEMSLARQQCVPTMEMVHRFGGRLAAFQNIGQAKRGKNQDRVYCGAYELRTKDVLALRGASSLAEVKAVQIFHVVENGEFAHANLRIEVDTNGDEDAVEDVKTLIIDRLWTKSAGPEKYVCLRDERVQPHPSELLTAGPRGAYVEQRTRLTIALDFVRYALIHFPKLWLAEAVKKLKGFF